MIQELLGGAASSLLASDNNNKTSFINGAPPSHLFQSCTAPPPTTTTTAANVSTTATATNPSDNNLRCPRCDSANTKFCYYNNYNLTQPRHFCKTCRRYWTKGGALRNVPIGGGCRKNKSTIVTTASKSTVGSSSKLLKTISPDDIARAVTTTTATTHPHLGFDHDLHNYSNPILWGSSSSSPQPSSSHLLALLRATSSQNPNPNHNPLSSSSSTHLVKDENMAGPGHGPHMMMVNTSHQASPLAGRPMGLDHLGHQVPSLGLSTTSLWRSTNQNQPQHQNGNTTSTLLRSEAHNSGMQELYQRLIRSSSSTTTTPTTNNYFSDHHHQQSNSQPMVLMGNAGSTSVASILDSAPVASDQLGYGWNVNPPAFSWSDLPTTNGAYP